MAVNLVARADPPRQTEPALLRSWYTVCASAELPPGRVRSWKLGAREFVLFRGQEGRVHALAAHCTHLGAHLAHGTVVGEHLRCPLHHWQFDGGGTCRAAPGCPKAVGGPGPRAFPVAERYGTVLVFNGPVSLFEPPEVGAPELRWCTAAPTHVECSWLPVAANAFDIEHLRTVHHRDVRDAPLVERLDPFTLRLRYTSRVLGTGPSDRLMKALSSDHIRVNLTLHGGTLLSVESDLGRTRTALMAGLRPVPGGVSVLLSFAAPVSRVPGLTRLRLEVARWLFTSFLRRDLSVLNGMRFDRSAAAKEPVMRQLLDFATQLPEAPDAESE